MIKNIVAFVIGFVTSGILVYLLIGEKIYDLKNIVARQEKTILLEKRIIMLMQINKKVFASLEKSGYKKIAIYGMDHLGKLVYSELEKYNLDLLYGIDEDKVSSEIKIMRPTDELPNVDVIVVATFWDYEKVKNLFEKRLSCPIVSIDNIV